MVCRPASSTKDKKSAPVPDFLPGFVFVAYRLVSIHMLYVGLLNVNKGEVKYVSVYQTPHYLYAKRAIDRGLSCDVAQSQSYPNYRKIHPQSHSVERFDSLIQSMLKTGYDAETSPILVFRHWRRVVPFGRWDVADGFHRLAILAAMGEQKVVVGLLKRRNQMHKRLINKIITERQD